MTESPRGFITLTNKSNGVLGHVRVDDITVVWAENDGTRFSLRSWGEKNLIVSESIETVLRLMKEADRGL